MESHRPYPKSQTGQNQKRILQDLPFSLCLHLPLTHEVELREKNNHDYYVEDYDLRLADALPSYTTIVGVVDTERKLLRHTARIASCKHKIVFEKIEVVYNA